MGSESLSRSASILQEASVLDHSAVLTLWPKRLRFHPELDRRLADAVKNLLPVGAHGCRGRYERRALIGNY
jgi:hypothetical protein